MVTPWISLKLSTSENLHSGVLLPDYLTPTTCTPPSLAPQNIFLPALQPSSLHGFPLTENLGSSLKPLTSCQLPHTLSLQPQSTNLQTCLYQPDNPPFLLQPLGREKTTVSCESGPPQIGLPGTLHQRLAVLLHGWGCLSLSSGPPIFCFQLIAFLEEIIYVPAHPSINFVTYI